MGDIVQTSEKEALLKLHVLAHSPIERIEIRNGTEVLETFRPYNSNDLGNTVSVLSGVEQSTGGEEGKVPGRDGQFSRDAALNDLPRLMPGTTSGA